LAAQTTVATSHFFVPSHGSDPNVLTVTGTEQLVLPTHAAATTAVDVGALQEEGTNGPGQLPDAVPNDAKVTLNIASAVFPQDSCT
jgi:hypothetical protein